MEHIKSDDSSSSIASGQEPYNNSIEGSVRRWSPEVYEQDVQLEIVAINENRHNHGEANTSISSDEGVHSLDSDKSETNPKTIRNQHNHGEVDNSISIDEGVHSLDSDKSETNPKTIRASPEAPSIDETRGEVKIPNVERDTKRRLSTDKFNADDTGHSQSTDLRSASMSVDASDVQPSVEDDHQERVEMTSKITIGGQKAHPTVAYVNPIFELGENPDGTSQSATHSNETSFWIENVVRDTESRLSTGKYNADDKGQSQYTDLRSASVSNDASDVQSTVEEDDHEPNVKGNSIPTGKKNISRRTKKPLFCFIVVAGIVVVFVILVIYLSARAGSVEQPRDCTVTPEGETRCPISQEHTEAVLLNATKYISEGNGEIVIPLNKTTDTTVNGIHFYVKDGYLHYSNPNASACYMIGTFQVVIRNNSEQIVQRLPPLTIEKRGPNDPVNILPMVYRNLTDGKNYARLRCAVSHCETVVTTANLMVPGYSNVQKPMSCRHEDTTEGLNTCSITMSQDSFENAHYIQCASISSNAESSVTINSTDTKYKEHVLPVAVISHGHNSTIVRHVTVNKDDVVVLEREHGKLLLSTSNLTNSRITLSVSKTEFEQICKVEIGFSPGTCIDDGKFGIRTAQGVLEIKTQVNDGPNLLMFPNTSVSSVGARLVHKGTYCITDGAQTVTVKTPGISKTGRFQTGSRVDFGNPKEYFIFDLKLNVLELTYVKKNTFCPDHNKTLEITVKNDNGVDPLEISSRLHVKANQYRISTTDGSFQENAKDKFIIFAVILGCRPIIQNIRFTINGKHDPSQASYQVINETGEMSFVKKYHLDVVTMQDNRTILNLTVSIIDDDGGLRFLSKSVAVFVIPGEFCEGRQPGCNFKHPYRFDQFVACGDGVVAAIHSCPEDGQVFRETKCTGFCEETASYS